MSKKFTSSIAGASIFITIIGLISRGLGLIREVVYASFFGLTQQFDIYLVGAVFPVTINSIIYYLSQNYFIPSYNKIASEDKEEAARFANRIFWIFLLAGLLVAVLLSLLSKIIISAYLSDSPAEVVNKAVVIFNILIYSLPFNAAFSILANYLNAEFEFRYPAVSQLFLNISTISLIVVFGKSLGIYIIPIGALSGYVFQFIFVYWHSKKIISFNFFKKAKKLTQFNNLGAVFYMIIVIELISQLYMVVDRYYIRSVDSGGIAALNYANTLFLIPISILSIALSTALFSKLSQAYSANKKDEVSRYFNYGIIVNILIFTPITALYIFFGDVIIKILYQHGAFNSSDTLITFDVLRIFSVGLIFYSTYSVINKMIYSAGLVKQLLIIVVISFIIKVGGNWMLVGTMKQNGLALASIISFVVMCIAGFGIVIKKINIKNPGISLTYLSLSLLNAAVSYYLSKELLELFQIQFVFKSILNIILFLIIYALNFYALKLREIKSSLETISVFSKIVKS